MTKSVRAVITGRVQGVGYRAWTVQTASRLGLHGWVRNMGDGTVEAIISGPPDKVDTLLEACKKGPFIAKVESLTVEPWNEPVEDELFVARPTPRN